MSENDPIRDLLMNLLRSIPRDMLIDIRDDLNKSIGSVLNESDQSLQTQLQVDIDAENYEEAHRLQQRIRELEKIK